MLDQRFFSVYFHIAGISNQYGFRFLESINTLTDLLTAEIISPYVLFGYIGSLHLHFLGPWTIACSMLEAYFEFKDFFSADQCAGPARTLVPCI